MEETKTLTQETEFEKKPEDQEEKEKAPETEAPEEKEDEKKKPNGENACGDQDKKKYDLAEVVEYAELKAQYDEL
jgi:DNA-nicking Smr family endonuclease